MRKSTSELGERSDPKKASRRASAPGVFRALHFRSPPWDGPIGPSVFLFLPSPPSKIERGEGAGLTVRDLQSPSASGGRQSAVPRGLLNAPPISDSPGAGRLARPAVQRAEGSRPETPVSSAVEPSSESTFDRHTHVQYTSEPSHKAHAIPAASEPPKSAGGATRETSAQPRLQPFKSRPRSGTASACRVLPAGTGPSPPGMGSCHRRRSHAAATGRRERPRPPASRSTGPGRDGRPPKPDRPGQGQRQRHV